LLPEQLQNLAEPAGVVFLERVEQFPGTVQQRRSRLGGQIQNGFGELLAEVLELALVVDAVEHRGEPLHEVESGLKAGSRRRLAEQEHGVLHRTEPVHVGRELPPLDEADIELFIDGGAQPGQPGCRISLGGDPQHYPPAQFGIVREVFEEQIQ